MTKTLNNKLNILVVEDTLENLAVAKEYFNSQADLSVDYATYRDEAIEMLNKNKYDGVITDRSIPGFKGDVKDWKFYLENNGWFVALNAELKNIPSVIHSEHGYSSYFIFEEKLSQESLQKHNEIIKKGFEIINENQYNEIVAPFPFITKRNGIEKLSYKAYFNDNLKKQDLESWVTALEYLKEKIGKQK